MTNLWLLTEERPKESVVRQIAEVYCNEYNKKMMCDKIKIKPIVEKMRFKFKFIVEGISITGIDKIFIKIVSGESSFIDFLLFKQDNEPTENDDVENNLLMAIEETKTSDDESRNTGVYQRGTKFAFIQHYYPGAKLYMLYNDELCPRGDKKPSDTSIFGTDILLTIGVKVIGKEISKWYKKFETIDDMIVFKDNMKKPPKGNVPITIRKIGNQIEITGRLSKPRDVGNIGHDPNIGALSMISYCVRKLGWTGDVIIRHHLVSQIYVNNNVRNKFLFICKMMDVKLEGIEMPSGVKLPERYWHYEVNSEKIASILFHVASLYVGAQTIYENHAGCERGYFRDKNNKLITVPKVNDEGIKIKLPDCMLYVSSLNIVFLIEGKTLSNLADGLSDVNKCEIIEKEYVSKYYSGAKIIRCVTIFGGNNKSLPHEKVIFYLNGGGEIYLNKLFPIEYVSSVFND